MRVQVVSMISRNSKMNNFQVISRWSCDQFERRDVYIRSHVWSNLATRSSAELLITREPRSTACLLRLECFLPEKLFPSVSEK